MPQQSSRSPRGPGRPPGAAQTQRNRLVQAARELLCDPDMPELTLQRAATLAGVTPALAHYYFGSREGLLEAVIRERVTPHVDDLVSAARVRAAQPVNALTFLLQRTSSLLQTDALLRRCLWIPGGPALLLRERLRSVTQELLTGAQRNGQLRTDLAPDYLADTLLGLVLFPFFDARQEEAGGERFAALTMQHVALLQDGIVRAQRPRQESSA